MVQIFMEKMKQEGFRNMLKDQFIKHTDACVEDFLSGNIKSLFGNLKELSHVRSAQDKGRMSLDRWANGSTTLSSAHVRRSTAALGFRAVPEAQRAGGSRRRFASGRRAGPRGDTVK